MHIYLSIYDIYIYTYIYIYIYTQVLNIYIYTYSLVLTGLHVCVCCKQWHPGFRKPFVRQRSHARQESSGYSYQAL